VAEYQELADAIIKGDNIASKDIAQKLVDENMSPVEILDNGLVPGMDMVGKKFKNNEIYLPEVLIAARAMKSAMEVIKPMLTESGIETKGKIIIGTVQGDVHDIGKNLVGMMLEGGGYTVIDLGADVPHEKFLGEIKKNSVKLIGLSALLTTTMIGMKTVIGMLKEDKETSDVRVMVGGAPLTQEFADSIGANGYAPDATGAVELAGKLL